jgi:hypothetical protein
MMTYSLVGWYETETGACMVYEQGENLSSIVARLQDADPDFGHTDMELELELPSGEVKSVESLVQRMVTCYDV